MTVLTGHRLGALIADRTGRPALAHEAEVVGQVLPFRVTSHVADELVDWARAPDDPLYRLVMPHRALLAPADFAAVERSLRDGDRDRLRLVVDGLRERLDPHPAGRDAAGLRHHYPETLLVLPDQGRTCHGPCASCSRWPRFAGDPVRGRELGGPEALGDRLDRHPEITDVLFAGVPFAGGSGADPPDPPDPFELRTARLAPYVTALLDRPGVRTVRIVTRAVSRFPGRFLDAPDADDLLRLLQRVVASGRHLVLTLYVCHPRELRPAAARRALGRLAATGAVLRTRGAVLRRVNDDAALWARMWREQTALGLVPYGMLVERGGGVRRCFRLPLARVLEVHAEALRRVPGLAGRVCGPVMPTELGVLAVDGPVRLADGPAFVLRAVRTPDPALRGRVAYARFDPAARWWDELVPYGPGDRSLIPGEPLTPAE
ncbi:lysine 2,3-aminomutase [Streptomyces venezuelae]|uniref:lysine 2,3-aminomutase n=1 Tax=Streptomyces venezuelae TaxID=54571 RepID=UPI0036335461